VVVEAESGHRQETRRGDSPLSRHADAPWGDPM